MARQVKFICSCEETKPCSHELAFIEKQKHCIYCNELKSGSHHCSGKKAYSYGYTKGVINGRQTDNKS